MASARLSVGRRGVNGEEEERRGAGVLDVMSTARWDQHAGAHLGVMLLAADRHDRFAIDDVDDLIRVMDLLGARVPAGTDRHDGSLTPVRLLQDLEEAS